MRINAYNPQYIINTNNSREKRICPQRTVSPTFCGHAQTEYVFKKGLKFLIQQTAFFREPQTKMFVRDYICGTFPKDKSINILSGACSTGEEAVTMSMLLYPMKDRVNIVGIDIGKKAIEQAKSRRYLMDGAKDAAKITDYFEDINLSPFSDCYLAFENERKGITPQQRYFRSLFNEFFEPTNEKVKMPFMERLQKRVQRNVFGIEPLDIERRAFRLREGMAENCSFIQGDIRDVEELTNGEKFNAILFNNAMYHLTTKDVQAYERVPRKDSENIVEDLISKFKRCLKPNGIIVFGEGEETEMGDSITVPKVMKKLGFAPMNKTDKHSANVWKLVDSGK